MNKSDQKSQGLGLLLAAAASLGVFPGGAGGLAPIRKLMAEGRDPQHKDSPQCPRCGRRRTWKIGDRWRCRNDGVYFDVAPVVTPEPEVVPEIVAPVQSVAEPVKKPRAPRKKKEVASV